MTYTDEDVQRMVELMESIAKSLDEGDGRNILPDSYTHTEFTVALKPFRPDPEEELIEAMCVAFTNTPQRPGFVMVPWDERDEESRTNFFHCMANAFDVVKEKGLPT